MSFYFLSPLLCWNSQNYECMKTCYDKLQLHFGQVIIQSLYSYTDAFVSSLNTIDIKKDLSNLKDLFEMSNLYKNHELSTKKKRNGGW